MNELEALNILKKTKQYSGFYVLNCRRFDKMHANVFTLSKTNGGGLDSFKVAVFDNGTSGPIDGVFTQLFNKKKRKEK